VVFLLGDEVNAIENIQFK